ncbi:hypothetical protein [Clostridium niameyense]|nr:hypothetical protein [Clostridium niameyense]
MIKNKVTSFFKKKFVLNCYIIAIFVLFMADIAYKLGVKIGYALNNLVP